MMARQLARHFCRLGEVHSLAMDAEQAAKMAQTDRQHSRRLEEPPNELYGFKLMISGEGYTFARLIQGLPSFLTAFSL